MKRKVKNDNIFLTTGATCKSILSSCKSSEIKYIAPWRSTKSPFSISLNIRTDTVKLIFYLNDGLLRKAETITNIETTIHKHKVHICMYLSAMYLMSDITQYIPCSYQINSLTTAVITHE